LADSSVDPLIKKSANDIKKTAYHISYIKKRSIFFAMNWWSRY